MANKELENKKIKLKSLAGIENLTKQDVAAILKTIKFWAYDFYNQAAGDKKVNGKFKVIGFALEEFDLSTSSDIEASLPIDSGELPDFNREPYLFMSDLVNFVEQTYRPVPNQFGLSLEQINQLNKLQNLFEMFGVTPSGNEEIVLKDLRRIEDFNRRQFIIIRIDEIIKILNLEQEVENAEVAEEKEPQTTSGGGGGGISFALPNGNSQQADQTQRSRRRAQETQRPEPQAPTPAPPTPLKISELDPQAKLYLQSLSIITINQALGRYFNDEALVQVGLKPGTRVTFDQLPLDIRQQLMDRAFLQVETLLLTGQFDLNSLIKNSSSRISFANQTALGLLIDVHGMKLINQAIASMVKPNNQTAFESEISKNEKQSLEPADLSERVKNQTSATSTKQAENVLNGVATDSDFARLIESELNVIGDEKFLDKALSEKLESIIGRRDPSSNIRIISNVRSIVEVYIQQGLPPEYLIPSATRFDYNRFVGVFGNELGREQFEEHKEELANLIIFYWKRKRAIWAREIRQEFGQEKYTPEEAEAMAKKAEPKKLAKQAALRSLNFFQGGRSVAEALADPSGDIVGGNPAINEFVKQQQQLIAKKLEEDIAKQKPEQQQTTLKTYFEFYLPGYNTKEYSIEIFRTEIVPKISPMDYYMISANEAYGSGSFARDGSGLVQQAFQYFGGEGAGEGLPGLAKQLLGSGEPGEGDNLIKNDFTRKALEVGIRAGVGALSGGTSEAAFKALEAAEMADPTGTVRALKNEVLNKIIEFVQKNWPYILLFALLATLGPMLAALMAALAAGFMFPKIASGARSIISGAEKIVGQAGESIGSASLKESLGSQISPAQASETGLAQTQAAQAPIAETLTSQFASPAMIVAGQAVIAVSGVALLYTHIYQVTLNSAFLTDFPYAETEFESSIEKESKYAEIEKTAKIVEGCLITENNGSKCENPSFPVTIEYTVVIKPKEDFSLQITDINDEIKFKQSQIGWEEAGQTPPFIPASKTLDFTYFKNLIIEQGGTTSPPLSSTPTPLPTGEEPSPTPTPAEGSEELDGEIVIPAGGSLTIVYTLDDLSSDYNHTAIQNMIEVNFYYQNAFMAGTDNVITGARVCLGECSGAAGCWPMTGTLQQMTFDTSFSHGANAKNDRWHDAYDISSGKGEALYGNPVYTPYDGELCFADCGGAGYGCHFVLKFNDGSQDQQLMFAHFQDPNPSISNPGSCMQVDAGYQIGLSGNRGFSSGNHLHYAAAHSGIFSMGSNPGFSILETLVPEDDEGNYPPVKYKGVTTCYE